MKILLAILSLLIVNKVSAQPCKSIHKGMSKSEVLTLIGQPTEIDSLGYDKKDSSHDFIIIWQYGEVKKDGNQRVEFNGDKVVNIIADGKKYDELLAAVMHGDVPKEELMARIDKINSEGCK